MRRTPMMSVLTLLPLLALLACALPVSAASPETPRMTKTELKALLGKPGLIVVDVRTGSDWEASKTKIAGAVREDPGSVDSWAKKYAKDKTIVLYCA